MQQAFKKVQPSLRREGFASIPKVKWEDVGGLDHLRKEFERYIVRRIKYPEDYEVNTLGHFFKIAISSSVEFYLLSISLISLLILQWF